MVLLIVALLLGSGMAVISTQMEQQRIKDTQKMLDDAREALLGYVASHLATDSRPYLPCPDKTTALPAGGTENDGLEDRVGGVCVVAEGNLPWVTLGAASLDGWGNRLRYRPTPAFANSNVGMRLDSVGTLSVNNAAGAAVAIGVPVVVLSHGPNMWGAISSSGTAVGAPPAANVNETENADNDVLFFSNPPVMAGLAGGEFDDVVAWLPSSLLFNRMLQAGVCVKTAACP
ncbi:MAG: prepilin-type cleavage/methylation domain-containing protein [Sulfuritalea sp.]|nr:prepilin-type cleavage/methylation domain-containing protein [Sulfuritalea sp.]MDP1984584.1 prepilin-type cleavage/methylation domain-containing protein [Sulfuritalea sp.]